MALKWENRTEVGPKTEQLSMEIFGMLTKNNNADGAPCSQIHVYKYTLMYVKINVCYYFGEHIRGERMWDERLGYNK